MSKNFRQGAVQGSTIVIILMSIALIGVGSFGIWSFISYSDAKNNVDTKIELAAAEAKREQQTLDEKKYREEAKNPNATFSAPEDLGRVRFKYPKNWSAYIDSEGGKGKDYLAYLNPSVVPPVPHTDQVQQRFGLRVAIYNKTMEDVLKEYEKEIKKGELNSSPATVNGKSATKIEGLFPNSHNKNDRIRGIAYFFKVNDKVLMLKTDAESFREDFIKIIVNSIEFN